MIPEHFHQATSDGAYRALKFIKGFLRRETAIWGLKEEYQRKLQAKQMRNAFKLGENNIHTQSWFAFCEKHK